MKSITIPCTCGMKGCTTELTLKEDGEQSKNVILSIFDEAHDLETFISLDIDSVHEMIGYLRRRYKIKGL